MSADLMQWAWEVVLWASIAIVLVVPLRWLLGRLFGARVSILAWMLVPLVCVATMLPPRTVEISVPVETVPATPVANVPVAATQSVRPAPQMLPVVLVTAWAFGALVWLLVLRLRQRSLDRQIGAWHCRGRVFLSEADRIGPMVVGVLRPRVVLPANFRTRFSRLQQRLVLAHELTHIRRRDPLWNFVAAMFQCLLWFNPLVHWAASRFRRDQELACDAAVLESRSGAKREYAGALLQLDHPPSFGLPAFGSHPLKERIRMLKRIRNDSPRRRRMGIAATALLALGIGFAAWAADTETRESDESEMFSFNFEVTVDGVRAEGTRAITGDEAVNRTGGKPRLLARERLLFEHKSTESGWSAEIEVKRLPDDRFHIDGQILRNGELIGTPILITEADKPAVIEIADPKTGESSYRIDVTPVELSSPFGADAKDKTKPVLRSAQIFLTVDGNSVGRRVEWPPIDGDTVMVLSYSGQPEPWSAQIAVERLDADQIMLCIESIETRQLADSAGCMMYDIRNSGNAYMMGSLGETGTPYRFDMVPNKHDEMVAIKP